MFDVTKFEVTKCDPPSIFVRCRRTGETYMFSIAGDGAVTPDEARSDQGEARRTAVAYLAQRAPAYAGGFVARAVA
jgi:hypothetical protein